MSRKYANPPLIEALCEFRFVPDQEWDLIIPGLFYEQIRNEFPKREPVRSYSVNISGTQDEIQHSLSADDRIRFVSDDEKSMIQIGHNLLVINRLKPYLSWESFRPLIQDSLNTYIEVSQQDKVARIGLRYINKVELPRVEFVLDTYFKYGPQNLQKNFKGFLTITEDSFDNGDILRTRMHTIDADSSDDIGIVLDFDYFSTNSKQFENATLEWIDNAHNAIETAFEQAISDNLRNFFGEE